MPSVGTTPGAGAIVRVMPQQVSDRVRTTEDALVLDVREDDEEVQGHSAGTAHVTPANVIRATLADGKRQRVRLRRRWPPHRHLVHHRRRQHRLRAHTHADYDASGRVTRIWSARASDDNDRGVGLSYSYASPGTGACATAPPAGQDTGLRWSQTDNRTRFLVAGSFSTATTTVKACI